MAKDVEGKPGRESLEEAAKRILAGVAADAGERYELAGPVDQRLPAGQGPYRRVALDLADVSRP
jgi:hypothetical protein